MRKRLPQVDDDFHPSIRHHPLHRHLRRTSLKVPEALDKALQRRLRFEFLVLQNITPRMPEAEQDSSESRISRVVWVQLPVLRRYSSSPIFYNWPRKCL